MSFEGKMEAFCKQEGLLTPGMQVICALSGGADSVALLWSFYLLKEKWELQLSAAHFNHGLRGEESDRDEEFVRRLCARLEIPLFVGRGQVEARGRGLEDAARKARYAFLESLDPEAFLATAHTADDNSETVLMHLIRGTGLRGLGGIAPKRGRLIRPILGHTRQEVEDFLELWSMQYVTDSSNLTDDFLRNRMRREVLPLLRRENPRFAPNCTRTALMLRQDEDYLTLAAEDALGQCRLGNGLDCHGFLQLHPAMKARVMGLFLKELGVKEPEQVHIAACCHLAEADRPSAWVELPGGVCLRRQYGLLTPENAQKSPASQSVPVPGVTRTESWEISTEILENTEKRENTPFTFALSCDKIGENFLQLRGRQSGDEMKLSAGHRSVKKAMIDRKLPAHLRNALPVIVAGNRIVAVAGLGGDEDFLAQAGERAILVRVSPR